jgi:hypothetical protein
VRSARTRVRALQSLSLHAVSSHNRIQAYSTKNRPVFGPGRSFGEPQGGDDIVAVGSPYRRAEFALFVLAQLLRVRAVCIGDPNVFGAATIADKSDSPAVRRKARLGIEAHTCGDFTGFAAGKGQSIEIADEFEDESFAVRRNIQGKPGALVSGEFDLACRLERKGRVFFASSAAREGTARRAAISEKKRANFMHASRYRDGTVVFLEEGCQWRLSRGAEGARLIAPVPSPEKR